MITDVGPFAVTPCCGVGMSVGSKNPVSLLRRFLFLYLALTVFGLGLHARLALYEANPDLQITSAKLSTETQSPAVLKSIEVRDDDPQPSISRVLALLLSGLNDASDPVRGTGRAAIALSNPTRSQMSCITSLRRPPPLSI